MILKGYGIENHAQGPIQEEPSLHRLHRNLRRRDSGKHIRRKPELQKTQGDEPPADGGGRLHFQRLQLQSGGIAALLGHSSAFLSLKGLFIK